jgi:phosphoglycolate phosphatase-like HAD superfamily hydrolase
MEYQQLDKKRQIYIKTKALEKLRNIKTLIFDFDGVLAQTNQSYRQTIIKVVDYYFLIILGLDGKEGNLVTLDDIQKFKDTGLFNNDWKLTYTIISYYINLILRKLEQENFIEDFIKQFRNIQFLDIQSFIQKLKLVGDFFRIYGINTYVLSKLKDDSTIGLDLFLAKTSLEKPKPIETALVGNDPEIEVKKEMLVKKLIPYDLKKPDLLKQLFEETYLGKDLFEKIYKKHSFFNFKTSLLDIEEFIPSKKTLKSLSKQFGKFGIYSGRPKPQGMYILKKYENTEYFDNKISIFLGDMLKSEDEMQKFGKPEPTLLIELLKNKFQKDTKISYIGDGIADAILVEKAKTNGFENLSFIGVFSSAEDSNKLFTEYSKHGTDAVVRDVNDIPYLFLNLGE